MRVQKLSIMTASPEARMQRGRKSKRDAVRRRNCGGRRGRGENRAAGNAGMRSSGQPFGFGPVITSAVF